MDLEYLKVAIDCKIDDFEYGIKQAEKGLGRLSSYAKETGESLSKYVTLPLSLLAGAAIKTAGDLQALEKGFAAVYKGAGDVGLELKKLQEVAKLPGLGIKEAEQGSIRLQAVGFSAEEARKALMAFGNAIATTGGGKNELDRVTVQLAQLSAKGKLLAQDLRPIIEAAPAAASALQRLYGTVDSEAISASLQKQGKSAQDFITDLTGELAKLPKVTGGIKNALENLSDSGTIALAKLGDSLNKSFNLESVAERLGNTLTGMADSFSQLDPATQKTILGLGGVAAATGPVLLTVGALGQALPIAIKGFEAFASVGKLLVTSLGPVGIAIAAVTAAAVYFIATYETVEDKFNKSAKAADDLDAQLTPLLKTYDDLTAKSKLTSAEQETLAGTVKQLAALLPGAATAFDKYGNAIELSRTKLVALQKAKQQVVVDDAIAALPEQNKKVREAADAVKFYVDRLNQIKKFGGFYTGGANGTKPALIKVGQEEEAAYRKQQATLGTILEEELQKRNDMAKRLGITQQSLDDNFVVREGYAQKLNKSQDALNQKKEVENKLTREGLEERKKALLAERDLVDRKATGSTVTNKAEVSKITKEITKRETQLLDVRLNPDTKKVLLQEIAALKASITRKGDARIAEINLDVASIDKQIKAIDELGVGSKSDAKKKAKEISELARANEAFRDGLRQMNLEYKIQGETFDVGAAKAQVYKTYLDKLIQLDKTGKVEDSPKFKKAMEEYQLLTIASERFQETAKLKGIFENTEATIKANGEAILALGMTADDAKERVKVLESQLRASLNGVESLQKAGAGENDEFLLAERQHAKELTAELEKARKAAAQAKRDADTDDLLESLNGGTGSKASTNFKDLASGKAQDELEERIRKAQDAVHDLQKDGADDVRIKQAQDAVAGLKGQLDLTDVYAGAAQQASESLGEIATVILGGIGGIITGQMSLTDGLASIFSKTLGIVGNFMKDFGKQLLLLGAGHVAMGLATANPAMVTAGGLELAAGGALYLGGTIMSAIGSAAAPSSSKASTPQTSASATPGSGTSSKDKQNVNITVTFAPVELRAEGAALRSVMRVDNYRLTQNR
ncbi:hypothetical protein AUC43_15335 [Hymenobacter sedentarius]|uniref:Tape measure protein N-terminal domain-containing protein n=1 Tax=Hymenobacter sedentarius TaxID=1411621 RepID=A0A0U4ASB6_9BACT|nr:tape measure protein [Hymenobacter sedentarius]ALW86336.1 hypothetical protein AUC43_15335 [Hymenobacter sedentarius]